MAIKKKIPAKKSVAKSKAKAKISGFGSWLKAIIIAVILLLIVRVFMFQSFVISTLTMSGNLVPGDVVIINKLAYGPRFPITPLTVPFAPVRSSLTDKNYFLNWVSLPYFRLPGYSIIANNDILAFNYPEDTIVPVDKRIWYVKRCVGLPGDTIRLKNNQLFVNGEKSEIENIQFEYRVKAKGKTLRKEVITKYSLNEGGQINKYGEYSLYLTIKQAKELRKEKGILSVEADKKFNNTDNDFGFPHDPRLNWSFENFGPVIVPQQGTKLVLTSKNISIYRDILEKFENCKVEVRNDSVYLNNMFLNSYYLKKSYYFVLDDNRDNSKDSRLWGFLPEDHIIGKVSFIVASFNPSANGSSKIRWNRTFSGIE